MKGRIRVEEVSPGVFSSERFVSFRVGSKSYALFVDEGSLEDHSLEVQLVDEEGDMVLVDLPRETFDSGNRVRIPRSLLLPA